MIETAETRNENLNENSDIADVVSIWKNATIAGMSAATAKLTEVFSEDSRAQIAVRYIDDEIDEILSPETKPETETADLLDLTTRIEALKRYSRSGEYKELRTAYGTHEVAPVEIDATISNELAGAA